MYLNKAINEAPYLRDPYMERAILEYNLEDYGNVEYYCLKALEIIEHPKTYINEAFSFNNTVYDLLSIAEFNLKKYDEALKYVNIAIEYDKDNIRLLENKKIIENYVINK